MKIFVDLERASIYVLFVDLSHYLSLFVCIICPLFLLVVTIFIDLGGASIYVLQFPIYNSSYNSLSFSSYFFQLDYIFL